MKRVEIVLVITLTLALVAACSKTNNANKPADQLASYEVEIKQQVAQITPELIRRPSPDEVRRRELTSVPPPDWSVTTLSQDQIRQFDNYLKERLIDDYIKEEVRPRVEGFAAKWNPILANIHTLGTPEKKAKAAELDRDLASLEKIDNRFQTIMLKTILQKTRELVNKMQLNLANMEGSK